MSQAFGQICRTMPNNRLAMKEFSIVGAKAANCSARTYTTQLVSVHDPDEYLHGAKTGSERERRLENILDAYRALNELKQSGQVTAIGVGSKTWQVVQQIVAEVPLDWVMLANSLTIYRHPLELLQFVNELAQRGIVVINSAVFHAGFFTGGEFFDYRKPSLEREPEIFAWRAQISGIVSATLRFADGRLRAIRIIATGRFSHCAQYEPPIARRR